MTTPTITMKPVKSSQIESIGHDPATNTLAIRFARRRDGTRGSLYHYRDFSAADFKEFSSAESIGSHFYKHIKPQVLEFPFTRIKEPPEAGDPHIC